MTLKLLAAVFVVPGALAVGIVSRYYTRNEISGRYAFLPYDTLLERQISRKIIRTWGSRITQKHRTIEDSLWEGVWEGVKSKAGVKLPGKFWLLDTSEYVFQMFPTGDVFVSNAAFDDLDAEKAEELLAHELGHLLMKHAQESLEYSKIMALVVGWLCRNNHHFNEKLKHFLLQPSYTQQQEDEANVFAGRILKRKFKHFVCQRALNH